MNVSIPIFFTLNDVIKAFQKERVISIEEKAPNYFWIKTINSDNKLLFYEALVNPDFTVKIKYKQCIEGNFKFRHRDVEYSLRALDTAKL